MSFLASTEIGEYIVPKFLLENTPPLFSPMVAITHAVTTAYWPMLLRAILAARLEPSVGYDNTNPRVQIARLSGKSVLFDRLNGSHYNILETLPVFIGAMIAGSWAKLDPEKLSKQATLWVFLRNAFVLVYLTQNKVTSNFRSLLYLWSLAISCNILREVAAKKDAEVNGTQN